ncbi:MAG: M23 family metallopeptidase, partial [Candidatus Dormibacteraeota bacterium]|nr:M23 family metallopeptidase [Candidatus Dormibacteraeota bacterium]
RTWSRVVPVLVMGGTLVSLAVGPSSAAPPHDHRLKLAMITTPALSRPTPDPWALAAGSTVGPDLVVWSNFVRIERDVAARTNALTQANDQVNAFRASSPSAVPLVTLLSRHQEALTVYQTSLQGEYRFFVALAQDARLSEALTQATVATPAARSVVAYNLDLVTSQLRQEKAIAAAESSAAAQTLRPVRAFSRATTFTAPVGGVVSQGFGATTLGLEPSITYQGVFYQHFHTGIDIAGALDTPIGAAAAGQVILAGSSRDAGGRLIGYGNYIVIDHGGGFLTLYGHLDQEVVATGQAVQRGQEIGLLGTTGSSTGPHLHFEIRRDGVPVDPETLLGDAVIP